MRDRRGRFVEGKDGFAHRATVVSGSCLLWWGPRVVVLALLCDIKTYTVRLVGIVEASLKKVSGSISEHSPGECPVCGSGADAGLVASLLGR